MGGHGGGGPWGVAEDVARGGSRRRWPVGGVAEEAVRGGHRGGGPWGVTAHHGGARPCTPRRKPHSEIQNLTGVFGFLSYENIVYRHKTEIACKILNF